MRSVPISFFTRGDIGTVSWPVSHPPFATPRAVGATSRMPHGRGRVRPLSRGHGHIPKSRWNLAPLRGRDDCRHGDPGRAHAAHGLRPFDHAMEAGDGRSAAYERIRMGSGVRAISAHSAIPPRKSRHEPWRFQGYLLVGMDASVAGPCGGLCVLRAVPVVRVARCDYAQGYSANGAVVRARRITRIHRLVDGTKRIRNACLRFAISAGDPSRRGGVFAWRDFVDGFRIFTA